MLKIGNIKKNTNNLSNFKIQLIIIIIFTKNFLRISKDLEELNNKARFYGQTIGKAGEM
jgi:hypothetical protein